MPDLLREIDLSHTWTPTLWWLGHSGFVVKFHDMVFYLDPCLSTQSAPLLDPARVNHADLVFASHRHPRHLDPATLIPMLQASPRAKVVLPKSAAEHAKTVGIPFERMTTTDAGLRVEYFKNGDYIRVYAVPSAHPELDHTPIGGYPYLGYLIRCGGCTIYHAGDCMPYDTLADRLRPYNVTVALVPIDGVANGNFTIEQAAELGAKIEAQWLVPMHHGAVESGAFLDHMLFHRPAQRFKIFERGECWTVPED